MNPCRIRATERIILYFKFTGVCLQYYNQWWIGANINGYYGKGSLKTLFLISYPKSLKQTNLKRIFQGSNDFLSILSG